MSGCFLCGSEKVKLIHKGVRDNPSIDVLKCEKCGLVRLSKFGSPSIIAHNQREV